MPRSGRLDEVVVFQRQGYATADGYGNVHDGTWATLVETVGDLMETPGGETVAAGAAQSNASAFLRVRYSDEIAAVTARDRVTARGYTWNILSLRHRIDRRDHMSEFRLERGVAI